MDQLTPVKQRLIVGITGASGIAYGVRALQTLGEMGIERHLIVSRAADMTRAHETDLSRDDLCDMADVVHPIGNVGASVASGSFRTLGMLIAPCSMRTLAEIATGLSSTLLTRAADVILKERRKLVLMTREAPLHLVHLRNMLTVTEMGGIIHPPVPALYTRPQTVSEIVDHSVARALDAFGLHSPDMPRWGEDIPALGQAETLPTASRG